MDAAAREALDIMGLCRLEDGRTFADTAAPFQLELAAAILDTSDPVRQTWCEAPRGSRKTTTLAALLLAVLRTQAPPMSRIYIGAADEDQAAELIDCARGLVERTPELTDEFIVNELVVTSARTGASITALPADASAFGKRAYLLVLDELSNWSEARKHRRFWSVLMSGNRKLPECRTVVLSNSGDPSHWSFKHRETARASRHWRFRRIDGPLPWLTPDDLEALAENLTPSEFAQLHLGQWTASQDRLATREDLQACQVLPGPLPPRPGVQYVVTLDLGTVRDATVMSVLHAEDAPGGRKVVLDRIIRWHGSKSAPVDLADVRDTLIATCAEYNRAPAVADPWQAKLLAQEATAAGVVINEFPFTGTSVGRIALALHQSIRQHRLELPADDEELAAELLAVRLVKNGANVYRLDHDSDQHDDQAVSIALGCFWLLDADPEPVFTIFDGPPPEADKAGEVNIFGLEIMQAAGPFAYKVAADDEWAALGADQDDRQRRIVRVVQ